LRVLIDRPGVPARFLVLEAPRRRCCTNRASRSPGGSKSDGRRIGVEFKRADAPQITPSMRIALNDLALDALYVVYPGERRYRLGERIEVVPLASVVA
jgi:hypothetical protein